MINTQDINNTVREFKDTVQALKRIDTLCDRTEKQYADFKETSVAIDGLTKDVCDTSIKLLDAAVTFEKNAAEGVEKLSKAYNTASTSIKEENNSFKAECNYFKTEYKSLLSTFKTKSQESQSRLEALGKDLSEQIDRCIASANKAECSIQECTRKYTLSTQATIEDLHIDQNRMAAELRSNAEKDTQELKADINSINQNIKTLSETLSAVTIAQQKVRKLLMVASSFAALASIISAVSLFI